MKKKPLTPEQQAECLALKNLFLAKKKELKLSQERAGHAIGKEGITGAAVNHYLNGVNPLNASVASDFARLLQVSVDEFSPRLAAEIRAMAVPLSEAIKNTQLDGFHPADSAELLGPISVWDDGTPLEDDEVAVPLLKDVEVAAGAGRSADEFKTSKKIRLGKYTLRNQGVQFDQAVCVTVRGNSMEPALPDGSTVGVNLGNKSIKDGKVYVITHSGELRVKAIYRLPGGGIRLRSYNQSEHPDEEYTQEEMADRGISILGKVFWSSVLWD